MKSFSRVKLDRRETRAELHNFLAIWVEVWTIKCAYTNVKTGELMGDGDFGAAFASPDLKGSSETEQHVSRRLELCLFKDVPPMMRSLFTTAHYRLCMMSFSDQIFTRSWKWLLYKVSMVKCSKANV